ncbi:eCIS core domain-containing protein [Bradyrhizobium aeschynomenes]|uniref:eCIS core domain-containing protein n=1 Tax=Bradyrhizobium aeschynomenes TaxID=2734909 RepID=UPI001AEEEE5D|nr:DUF4157 domain-containing protein [Bradyrhizobium aeschynomenes]
MKQTATRAAPQAAQSQSARSNRGVALSPPLTFPSVAMLQPRLEIGPVDDPLEREADAMASRVVDGPASRAMPASLNAVSAGPPRMQRQCACGGTCSDCRKDLMQRKDASGSTAASSAAIAPPVVHDVLRSPGQPLDAATRADLEPRFGRSFAAVRIHTDANAAASARAVGAQAYTVGHNVVFGNGHYAPQSPAGRRLLAHELTHVVQQGRGAPLRLARKPGGPGTALTSGIGQPAGGCGVCQLPMHAGTAAHNWIGGHFVASGLGRKEVRVFRGWGKGNSGRLDLAMIDLKRHAIYTGEVKPDSAGGRAAGVRDQLFYRAIVAADKWYQSFNHYHLTAKQWNPSGAPVGWLVTKGLPKNCGQLIFVNPASHGLYLYHCEPRATLQQLRPECACDQIPKSDKKKDKGKEKEKEKEKEKDKEKDKEKGGEKAGAANVGFGISLFGSSVGGGNAGVGVSVGSNSASVGTAGAGFSWFSDSAAAGAAGAGVSANDTGATALSAGAGMSSDSLGGSVATAGAGKSSDNTSVAAATAGAGKSEGNLSASAATAGKGEAKNNVVAVAKSTGSGKAENAIGAGVGSPQKGAPAAPVPGSPQGQTSTGTTTPGATTSGTPGQTTAGPSAPQGQATTQGKGTGTGSADRPGATGSGSGKTPGPGVSGSGTQTPGTKTGDAPTGQSTGAQTPGGKPGGAQQTGTPQTTGDAGKGTAGPTAGAVPGTSSTATPGNAATGATPTPGGMVIPLTSPNATEAEQRLAQQEATKVALMLSKASSGQIALMQHLIDSSSDKQFRVPTAQWVETMMQVTADITPDDLALLKTLNWKPGHLSPDELRKQIVEALKKRHQSSSGATAAPAPSNAAQKDGGKSGTTGGKGGKGDKGSASGDKAPPAPRGKQTEPSFGKSGGYTLARAFTGDRSKTSERDYSFVTNAPITTATKAGDRVLMTLTWIGDDGKNYYHQLTYEVVGSPTTETDAKYKGKTLLRFALKTTNADLINIAPDGQEPFLISPGRSATYRIFTN